MTLYKKEQYTPKEMLHLNQCFNLFSIIDLFIKHSTKHSDFSIEFTCRIILYFSQRLYNYDFRDTMESLDKQL